MGILALDPGVRYLGWAVLQTPERLAASGTLIPRSHLRGTDRLLWLLSRVQDLLQEWHPQVLAYESFVWFDDKQGTQYVEGRAAMCELIGGIQCLSLMPPHPVLMWLHPADWGQALVGQRSHTKEQVAWAVNARLGTSYNGGHQTNHESDATGIALVAQDRLLYRTSIEAHPRA